MCVSQQAEGPVFWHSCLLRKITLWDPTDPVWQGIGGRDKGKEGLGWYKSEHENHSSASVAYLHAWSCQTLNIISNIKTASCHWHDRAGRVNSARFRNCFLRWFGSEMHLKMYDLRKYDIRSTHREKISCTNWKKKSSNRYFYLVHVHYLHNLASTEPLMPSKGPETITTNTIIYEDELDSMWKHQVSYNEQLHLTLI